MAVLLLTRHTVEAVLGAYGQVQVVTSGNRGRGRVLANAACSPNMTNNIIPNSLVSHMEMNSIITIANAITILKTFSQENDTYV